ncbi:MAG: D-glycerate dehydrogenase [Deltaproteobacteria bacterium]|nr:D-glycerate dehydrogenase [Deltaproteobacteria bacterium]
MQRWKALVTCGVPVSAIEMIRARCDLVADPVEECLPHESLLGHVWKAEGILTCHSDRIDRQVMDTAPRLRVVANYAVGYDNIDVPAATARGILVCNTPGVLTETTADLTWALIMAVARRVVESDRFIREKDRDKWPFNCFLGTDVYGKTLGIVGMGRIGSSVARRAQGFGMRIIYYNRKRVEPSLERELKAAYVNFETLLREADFVTLHVPSSPDTRHLIGSPQLSMMKPTSFLINASRGMVVDEAALLSALRDGAIAGAALDVYENEPHLTPGLGELPNVVLTPHIGSATRETREKMALMAAENLLAALEGKRPPNLVNPDAFRG